MRSLFASPSPNRGRKKSLRDSQHSRRGSARDVQNNSSHGHSRSRGNYHQEEAAAQQRRSFAFMKYSPDRRSSSSMKATRDHSRQIAMHLGSTGAEQAPMFQANFPEPSAFEDFNPFGHESHPSTSITSSSRRPSRSRQMPATPPPPPPQEDLFAQARAQEAARSSMPPPPSATANTRQQNYQQNRKGSMSSHRSSIASSQSFGEESLGSAYDMDFLPMQAQQQPDPHFGTPQQPSAQKRRSGKGRPPRIKGPSSEVSFGSSTNASSINWPSSQSTPQPASKSMSTFPSNSSMQSSFAAASGAMTPPAIVQSPSNPGSAGGAAARRRMRSHMRGQGSSVSSVPSSDAGSVDGTPPASPMSGRRMISSNLSMGSSHGGGGGTRNRVSNYTMSGNGSNWQHSPSTSVRGGGGSVCSSTENSEIDLFESQHDGGFSFDAFGLDASEIDREVQEALSALAGDGHSHFGNFAAGSTTSNTSSSHITQTKPQDNSIDEFETEAWDSPPESRRSTPVPPEEEDDGFVDGFRVSKPSPLPMVSVNRQSPVSSERSSSLSSITDHNTDHGAPRRNMFKEQAGFLSSTQNDAVRRPRASPGPSPSKDPPKRWVPPPGAVKMLTPPRQERRLHTKLPQEQQAPVLPVTAPNDETDNYWKEHLQQIPNMLQVDDPDFGEPQQHQQRTQQPRQQHWQKPSRQSHFQQPKQEQQQNHRQSRPVRQRPANTEDATPPISNKWQSAAMKFTSPFQQPQNQSPEPKSPKFSGDSPFRKTRQEEKKDDEDSVDRDNHTATTAATTAVTTETHHPQTPTFKASWPEDSPRNSLQEQNTKEFETPPSTSNWAFKSQATLNHVPHDHMKVKPQQERVNECSDQRASFASMRERLKSPIHDDQHKTSSSPKHLSRYQPFPSTHTAKSEVGVSSTTWQKSKVASVSSAAKSDVGAYGESLGNQQPLNQSESAAVLNRVRGVNVNASTSMSSSPPNPAPSPTPAFMAVKLRKTPSSVSTAAPQKDEAPDHGLSPSESFEHIERNEPILSAEPQARKLSYREQREIEAQQHSSDRSPSGQLLSQAQKMSQQQQLQERQPSPKKLSYRERRELELAQERELKEQQNAHKADEQPQRDVADLIRRRIAANKSKGPSSPNDGSQQETKQQSPISRSRLRPTGIPTDDRLRSSCSGESFRQQDSSESPDDEIDSMLHRAPETIPLQNKLKEEEHAFENRMKVSRDAAPATVTSTQPSSLSAVTPPREAQPKALPKFGGEVGGLAALHAQLKQLKVPQSPGEEPSHEQERVVGPSEARPASRRVESLAEQLSQTDPQIARSSSSDQHSSPPRTPKATYAMLNAFLHGRETVSAEMSGKSKITDREEGGGKEGSSMKASSTAIATQPVSDNRPALKDDPKYARYFSMLKVGMPMDVVKHAMVRDNLDPNVMDGDHNKPVCIGVPLKDDPKYAKYFKMLKIGMPMEAVKHAMERDGHDSHIMDQDHSLPADPSNGKQDDGPKEKDSHRRARLHWKPKHEVRRNTLWAQIHQDPELDNIEIDEQEFAELFQAELDADKPQGKKGKKTSPRKGAAVRVIDPKRANNGGIILARLKMTHDDMADVVDRIDENSMTAEQIEHIIEYLPTNDERRALEAYMLEGGQDAAEKFDGLCECEKFMVSMMTVKHAKRKVRALLFKLQFESCLEALYQETHLVETSCDELSNSVRLRQLLGIVLTFGNRLNTAGKGKKKKAGAFTLDSLLKLNQAKAFDKKTTFLQYIVLIVQRNNELLLRFKDDLPTVSKAEKVFWDQCVSDLEEVENQLENVRRIALYQARQVSKFRRKKKKQHDGGGGDDESLSDMSLSLEEEVEALRSTSVGMFTLAAIKKVSFLRDRVEGTKVKFNKLLEYFGEDDKNMQPHDLFSIIVKFCSDFEKAKEQVYADEKKKKREERKRQSATGQTPQKATNSGKPPQHSMLRASSMQPNASRLIDDMKRRGAAPPRNALPTHSQEQHLSQQNPPAPRHDNSNPHDLDSRSHQPSKLQRPSHAEPDGRYVQQPKVPISSHSMASSPENQSQSVPILPESNPIPPQTVIDDERMTRQSASAPVSMRPREEVTESSSPKEAATHSYAKQSSQKQVGYSNEISRQMVGQGPPQAPPRPRTTISDPIAHYEDANQEMGSSNSSEQHAAALRRKARMRRPSRSSAPSSEDSQVQAPDITSPPSRNSVPVERHNSAPVLQAHPDQRYHRQSSVPLGEAQNSVPSSGVTNASPSGNLMRNKLRSKRLLERRQRVMERNATSPNAS